MKIISPSWEMTIQCPCCDQGSPRFASCPICDFLTVVCDEVGDTFADPKNLEVGFMERCPTCNEKTDQFMSASSKQITDAGFNKQSYR